MNEGQVVQQPVLWESGHCIAIAGGDARDVSCLPVGCGLASVNAGPAVQIAALDHPGRVTWIGDLPNAEAFRMKSPGVWTRQ